MDTAQIDYRLIHPGNREDIRLIGNWYLDEWGIPIAATEQKLLNCDPRSGYFHLLMVVNNLPVATGGIHPQVSLLDKEPRFKTCKHWLALVYTISSHRGRGLGALLCNQIQDKARSTGIKELFLFTHTAENLYHRLGWSPLERLVLGPKNIVVMKKELSPVAGTSLF